MGVCSMLHKQTITGGMCIKCKQTIIDVCSMICKQDNYWAHVAWYVNKQLLEVCSMISKQTITGSM